MAQADYIISNQTFPNTRADINSHLQAIATNNSGTSAPTTQYAGQFWIDTTSSTWTLYIHDGSDDIQFATIDTSANTVNFTDSALDVVTDTTPQLGGNLDLNSNDITGTGNINITGTGTFSGDLTVDTNTLKVDSSNNRVGIGTASPVRKFVIYDSSEPYLALQNSTTGTGTADGLLIGIGSVNSFFINRENQDLFFSTNNTEAMRITSSGNVGIGTSSPTDTNGFGKALDIQGSTGGAIYVGSSGDRGIFAYASGEQHIINPSASGTTRFTVNGSERMRIDSSGQVGIGTTSPNRQLTIAGGTNTGLQICGNGTGTGSGDGVLMFVRDSDDGFVLNQKENSFVSFNTNNTEAMRINSSGQVGIGTSSPSKPLEIVSSAQTTLLHLNSTAGVTSAITFANTGSNDSISISAESDDLKLRTDDGNILFAVAENSEKMRIDSSGNVGIGTSSPGTKLEVVGTGVNGIELGQQSDGSDSSRLFFTNSTNVCAIRSSGGSLKFSTGATIGSSSGDDRVIINSSGSVGIGKTPNGNVGTVGFEVFEGNALLSCRDGNTVAYFNRNTNDGTLIQFSQAGTAEGTISVSGATVSYNGFTGTHWSRFTDNSTPTILKGTVLETLDEMCDWYNLEFDVTTTTQDENGNDVTNTVTEKVPHVLTDTQSNGDVITYNHEGTDVQATIVKENDVKHMKSKVSDTVDAKNVYGVFVAYDLDGEGYNDFYVASVGSFVVRIKANETIAKGDLLQSNGDGTAKVQTDDAVRSNSFAKVLSTTIIETYEDGSYLVPCSLMC